MSTHRTQVGGHSAKEYSYEYDDNGNITRITQGPYITQYHYDEKGQLIREDNSYTGKTYVYVYDNAGNRISASTYDMSLGELETRRSYQTYSYGGTWGDVIEASGAVWLTYDGLGNPLLYHNGYKTYNFTWERGNRLAATTKSGVTTSYTYNDQGIRTSKTVGTTKHEYMLDGSRIIGEQVGDYLIMYIYDSNNSPIGMQVRTSGQDEGVFTRFFFEKNIFGDIIGVYNETHELIGHYFYDAFGNCSVTSDSDNTALETAVVTQLNPFRYRGYYYDYDTELYYLQTRYYDPVMGRFISADKYISTGTGFIGFNMFAYCNNNPIMFVDPSGLCAKAWAAGYQGPCPGQGKPGCMDNWPQFQNDSTIITSLNRDIPPDHPDYNPPKKGGNKKVKNPNGVGWGWPASDGGVWIPSPNMHGGEGWIIQYPGGGHSHAYPGGGVRNHFEAEQAVGVSIAKIFGGALFTALLIIDNSTVVGAFDDGLLVGSAACFSSGIDGLLGKQICTECGEIKYGY